MIAWAPNQPTYHPPTPSRTPVSRLKPISWRHQGARGGATAASAVIRLSCRAAGKYVFAYGAPPCDSGLSMKGLIEA